MEGGRERGREGERVSEGERGGEGGRERGGSEKERESGFRNVHTNMQTCTCISAYTHTCTYCTTASLLLCTVYPP